MLEILSYGKTKQIIERKSTLGLDKIDSLIAIG